MIADGGGQAASWLRHRNGTSLMRVGLPSWPSLRKIATMEEPIRLATPADNQHYRELADKHRRIAGQCQSPGARQRILDLASWYEGRADHLETRGTSRMLKKGGGICAL